MTVPRLWLLVSLIFNFFFAFIYTTVTKWCMPFAFRFNLLNCEHTHTHTPHHSVPMRKTVITQYTKSLAYKSGRSVCTHLLISSDYDPDQRLHFIKIFCLISTQQHMLFLHESFFHFNNVIYKLILFLTFCISHH